MSFLLEGKPRRRNRLPPRKVPVARNRLFSKDAANSGGGGQVQIQRVQRQHSRPQARVIPPQQQQQHDQKKQDAMQSAGMSMDQVMEDLRVLEEQQRDSQRKLSQIKMLKQNRLDRRSTIENQLASLKYKNGEHRAQLNRAREVLSKSTAEMEAVKLAASRNDECLKSTDNKLKRALMKSRTHQTYRRKIDSRIINIRSHETVCHRLLTTLREDVKTAENNLQEIEAREHQIREAVAKKITESKHISVDTSKVRSEVSGIAEDLRSAKQMQASTKLRSESIQAEIEAEDARHCDETDLLRSRLEDTRGNRASVVAKKKATMEHLETENSKIRDLWKACVAIQMEEGHEPSPEPTEHGPFLSIDVDIILKTLREEEHKLVDATTNSGMLTARHNRQKEELRKLEEERHHLSSDATKIQESSLTAHRVELDRTSRHETFLSCLENEREDVRQLRASLIELNAGMKAEHARLEGRLGDHKESIRCQISELDSLKNSLSKSKETLVENKRLLEQEKTGASAKVESSKEKVDSAKMSFEKKRGEVEALRNFEDTEFQLEVDEIAKTQEMMIEDTIVKIARLLKENPELDVIDFEYDTDKTSEERIATALVDIEKSCKQRTDEVRMQQKEILSQIRQDREEKQRRMQESLERKRKAKEHKARKLKEAAEMQRLEQEAAERQCRERHVQEEAERLRQEQLAHEAADRQRTEEATERQHQQRLAHEVAERQRKEEAAERQHKERLAQEEKKRQRAVREEAEREKKEQRRAAREEKRRKRAAIEAASAREAEEGLKSPIVKLKLPNSTTEGPGNVVSTQDPKMSPVRFSSAFEDELQCENENDEEMNGLADGCLTQRIGLDVPTPTSNQSDEGEPNPKLRLSKVHWNNTLLFEAGHEATNEVEVEAQGIKARAHREMESEGGLEGTMMKKERRKVFGSTATDKKARERQEKEKRRLDRYTSSSRENTKSQGTNLQPSSPKSHSSRPSKRTNRGNAKDRQISQSISLPARKRSTDAQEDSARSSARANVKAKKHLDVQPPKSHSSLSSQKEKKAVSRERKSSKPSAEAPSKQVKLNLAETSKTARRTTAGSSSNPADQKLKSSTASRPRAEKSKASGRSDRSVVSVRSATSGRSRISMSSRASRKRGRSQDASSQQTTGISSGERVASKSRRRRADATTKVKARSGGVLGMSDDFGFKF